MGQRKREPDSVTSASAASKKTPSIESRSKPVRGRVSSLAASGLSPRMSSLNLALSVDLVLPSQNSNPMLPSVQSWFER